MSFFYFIPNAGNGFSLDDARALGLGDVLAASMHHRQCDGPGGRHGVIVARSDAIASVKVGYWPDAQTWRRLPGAAEAKEVWLGYDTESPPGPAELIRAGPLLPGHQLELADGRNWLVPVAIQAAGPPLQFTRALPAIMDLSEAGEWVPGDVLPVYRFLWEIATDWFDAKAALGQHVVEENPAGQFEDERFTDRWIFDAAVKVLSVHYHVGNLEVAMLKLFSSTAGMEVLDHLIDEPGYRAIVEAETLQKKTADGSSTDGGSAD